MTSITATSTTSNEPLPVDRQWLRKLVQKYECNGSTASSSSSSSLLQSNLLPPIFMLAPMVDQSDLPFRLLCRKYGCQIAVTPMIHSRLLVESADYRSKFLPRKIQQLEAVIQGNDSESSDNSKNQQQQPDCYDRPLIAQLCGSGHAPQFVLQAALMLQDTGLVHGIDLNCGCPQNIAKRGKYGAFLLEQPDDLVQLVKLLTDRLQIPVSVKVRLLPRHRKRKVIATTTVSNEPHEESDDDDESVNDNPATITDDDAPQSDLPASLALYRRLVHEGKAHMLTIHGRTRHHKGHHVGPCDMEAIKTVVKELGEYVPIVANGSIASRQDAIDCLAYTKCDAVMSSEAILEYPALFEAPLTLDAVAAPRRSRVSLAREYLDLCETHPPQLGGQGSGFKCIRMHLHRILHDDLQSHSHVRENLCKARNIMELRAMLAALQKIHVAQQHTVESEQLSWYYRHQKPISEVGSNDEIDSANVIVVSRRDRECAVKTTELAEDNGDCVAGLFGNGSNNLGDDDEYDY